MDGVCPAADHQALGEEGRLIRAIAALPPPTEGWSGRGGMITLSVHKIDRILTVNQ